MGVQGSTKKYGKYGSLAFSPSGEYEIYNACGSACIETCDNKPIKCAKKCIAGYFCGYSDYVRESKRSCNPSIHRDDCPKSCEEHD